MKIVSLRVKNFKSLKDTEELGEFGDLTTFIGPNSAGKTTLLEGLSLFFSQFKLTNGKSEGITTSLWHGRTHRSPIEFKLTLKMTEDELQEVFSEPVVRYLKKKYPDNYGKLEIKRKLVSPKGEWHTDTGRIAELEIVKNDKTKIDENLLKPLGLQIDFTAFFFTQGHSPENVGGVIHVVDQTKKIVYPVDERVLRLISTKRIKGDTTTWGQDVNSWATANQLTMANAPPTVDELPEELPISGKAIEKNVEALVIDSFVFIPAVRGIQSADPKKRTSQIPGQIMKSIQELYASDDPEDNILFSKFDSEFSSAFQGRLRVIAPNIYVEQASIRFPIEYIGGGHQERFALQTYLMEEGKIYGLEEPELHQHPVSARNLVEHLKRESKTKQLFLTTHSPIFVDKQNVDNNWIVAIEGIESHFQRVKELREVLDNLGASPTDSFFPDKIVLVEGKSDKIFLSKISEKFGVNLASVKIIPTFGKSNGRYNLRTWQHVIAGSQIKLLMLLDQDAKSEVPALAKRKLIEAEDVILLEENLEESYPISTLQEALKEIYGFEVQRDLLSTAPRVEVIENMLRQENKYSKDWKEKVAENLGDKMAKKDVPKEFKHIVERLQELGKEGN